MNVLLFLIASAVHAQITQTNTQFPNPGFEKWSDHNCSVAQGTSEVPDNWHTFDEVKYNATDIYIPFVGNTSAIAKKDSHFKLTDSEAYGNTGTSLQLATHDVKIVTTVRANGTITSGRTRVGSTSVENYQNYNFSQLTVNTDNDYYPQFGNHKWYWDFVGCPDSMSFYYKTNWTTSSNKPLIKVYLHTGEWYDHASGVVNASSDNQNNDISNSNLIAYCQTAFNPSTSWKRFAGKFIQYENNSYNNDNDYSTITRPQYILASFSTNESAGGGSSNDRLSLDELWCIYDKGLSSLTIDGTPNDAALIAFNAAEFTTHEPARTFDNSGNPIFNNSGTATWNYPDAISCTNIPQVAATPKSKLISEFTVTQATAENGYKATIYVKHNDNSTFYYYIQFIPPTLPTITLNNDGDYTGCEGDVITVEASGANSYNWSNGLGNTATVHPTTSGTYTVTGTASNGCTGTATATVNILTKPATPNIATVSNSRCIAPFNGSIMVNAPLGQGYTYSINGTTFQAETIFDGLESNEYSITVQNNAGCQTTLNGIIVENVTEPIETVITIDHAGNSYEWNGSTYTESGDYSMTFTAANGCDSMVTLHLTFTCTSIDALPYTENFDNYTTSTTTATGEEPTCWELVREDVVMTDANRPQLYYKSDYAHSGSYSLLLNYRGVYAMPALSDETNVPLNQIKLEMYLRQPKTYYALEVGVWEDNGTFVPVATFNNTTTGIKLVECDFSNYNGNGKRIAFRNISGDNTVRNYSYNYIDDITLTEIPQTECGISELPYAENFDSYTTSTTTATGTEPLCWELVQEDVTMTDANRPQLYYKSTYAHSGSYSLLLNYRGVYAMPEISENIPMNQVRLEMYLRQPKAVYQLEVGVWENNGTFVPVRQINNSSTGIEFVECDFSTYNGQGRRIAFRNVLDNSVNYNYSYNYIDDINLDFTVMGKSIANDETAIGANTDLENIAVYPNPTTGQLHIDAVDVQKVECYNQMGQLVSVYENVNELNISGLTNGVYMLRITVPQGVTMRKVVKQ